MLKNKANKKILVVEDAAMVALHIKKSLEGEGYAVPETFSNGEDILAYLQNGNDADLILMDIMLEGKLDGITTVKEIKEINDISVIYLTALTDKKTIERAKETHPYGYIMKPFNEKELHTNIEMALLKLESESKLKASEERFFSTINSIGDAVITLDDEMLITYANPVALQISGQTYEEVLSKPFHDVFNLQFKGNSIDKIGIKEISDHLVNNPDEYFELTSTGKNRHIGDFRINKVVGKSQHQSGYVIIFRDISNRVAQEGFKRIKDKKTLATIIEGQERERLRVINDIKEGLTKVLQNIRSRILKLDELQRSGLISLIDQAISESYRIADYLLPVNISDTSLEAIFDTLCKKMSQVYDADFKLTTQCDNGDVDDNLKTHLFRIGQEASLNAIKHAACKNVSIDLQMKDDCIHLVVRDDGQGFDFASIEQSAAFMGKGLQSIRDRVTIMSGVVKVNSVIGKGTSIEVVVPK